MKASIIRALLIAVALKASTALADDGQTAAILNFHNHTFVPIIGIAAQPADHTAAFRGGTGSYACHNLSPGGSRIIRYPFTVPDARTLQFVRLWGFKGASTADTTARVRRTCMSQTQLDPVTVILDTTTVTGSPGPFTAALSLGTETPSNLDCRYWVEIEFGPSSQACASTALSLRIERIRVQSLLGDRIFRGSFRPYIP